MDKIPATHKAVSMPGPRQPLTVIDVPTVAPQAGEVLVNVQWVGSSPIDLHQADGGLLLEPNMTPGDSFAGTVAVVGEGVTRLSPGDRVTGFAFDKAEHKSQQEYVTVPAYRVSKLPGNISLQEAATVSSSLVTIFHSVTHDLGLPLPWPLPEGWKPDHADTPILVWGAAGSVGLYAVRVLSHWGYKNIIAVASAKHHDHLKTLGAKATFSYRDGDVTDQILAHVGEKKGGPRIPFVLDCIGSLDGTLEPITRVAETGSRVAIMLPVIVRDATEDEAPEYEGDVTKTHAGKWAQGVELRGVRTHFYAQNEFLKEHLQPEIIPVLLEQGVVKPLKQKVVEGDNLLERAKRALDFLRKRDQSGERLVWRISA